MAGLQAAACAGTAGGNRDAGKIETDQLGIRRHAGETIAADRRMPRRIFPDDQPPRTADRIVKPTAKRREIGLRLTQRRRIAERRGEILRARPVSPLLSAGRRQRGEVADEQGTDARWAAPLMRGKSHEIGDIGQLARRRHLRRIDQQKSTGIANDLHNFAERLLHPGLAVAPLYADDRTPGARPRLQVARNRQGRGQRFAQGRQIDNAVRSDRHRPRPLPRRAQDRIMLHGRNDPLSGNAAAQRDSERFAGAARQQHLAGPAIGCPDRRPRLLQCGAGRPAFAVRRRGIGPHVDAPPHRRDSRGRDRRGGGVVEIKAIWQNSFHIRARSLYSAAFSTPHPAATRRQEYRCPK